MANTFDPSTQEVETGRFEFKISLVYIVSTIAFPGQAGLQTDPVSKLTKQQQNTNVQFSSHKTIVNFFIIELIDKRCW